MSNRTQEDRRDRGLVAAFGVGGAVLAVCAAFLLATPSDGFWINDCGSKALVALRLRETAFRDLALDHPARLVDPEARTFPIPAPYAVLRNGRFFSFYPPAYSALSTPWLAVFGLQGLRIPAALGLAICAGLLVVWLAPVLGAATAAAAGAGLALATPLFFYGVTVWEHSLTVALSLGAWLLASRPTPWRLIAAGLVVGLACWLREELALMGVALAIASVVRLRRAAPALWLAAGAALPAVGLLLLNASLFGEPLGLHVPGSADPAAGVPGWRVLASLLGGYGATSGEAVWLGAAALLAPPAGWWAARHGAGIPAFALAAAVGLAAWAFGIAHLVAASEPLAELARYNGLLVQLPMLALAGVGAAAVWRNAELSGLRIGVLSGGIFLALACAAGFWSGSGHGAHTGFGVHWGPRVLLPAVPSIVALAVVAGREARRSSARALRGMAAVAGALLVTAGVASSVEAGSFLAHQKRDAHAFAELLREQASRYIVTTHPMMGQHLAALWDLKPMLLVEDGPALSQAIGALGAAGVPDFLAVVPADAATIRWIPGLACRRAARYRGERLHYFDLDIQQ
ncbi:MAG: hypothetical protein ACE5FL_03735, partial [Myxococcota bacterium]